MQKPYYIRKKGMTENGCFIRIGASAQPMTEAMIERLLYHRQANSLSITAVSRQKILRDMIKDNLIEKHGEKRHTYYTSNG